MAVNFRVRGISRSTRKLTRIFMSIKKNKRLRRRILEFEWHCHHQYSVEYKVVVGTVIEKCF
jgi:hypothetical protein